MRYRILAAGMISALAGSLAAQAEPVTAEDFAKFPSVSSVSMSLEGDMLVGVIADPSKDGDARAAAYWDLSGEIDTTKPLVPSNITPSSGKTKFYGASALKNKKSLWFTVQPYIGALEGCGEGKTTGSTKKYLQKVYMGNERIKKIDDLPDGRAEIGMIPIENSVAGRVGERFCPGQGHRSRGAAGYIRHKGHDAVCRRHA